eukprot:CAMPEP_0198140338 /NCGR_PEP_ID=MMETSP1443-20131203/3516_1 /TAXON_ID=186043 /ORGANISM="Entomoneis sp., Strain CCMP2396" /LENGTH=246 /DNA_ID=CAMNT_0043802727 /DNA_START=46 /DNA_END=786 /DNA_ORIENTATION=+
MVSSHYLFRHAPRLVGTISRSTRQSFRAQSVILPWVQQQQQQQQQRSASVTCRFFSDSSSKGENEDKKSETLENEDKNTEAIENKDEKSETIENKDEKSETRVEFEIDDFRVRKAGSNEKEEKNEDENSDTIDIEINEYVEKEPLSKRAREKLGIDRSLYTEEVPVRMPDMDEGDNMILRWYHEEGDVILRNDILCDIATPNFSFAMQTEDEHPAILSKILVDASDKKTVPDEEVICILLHPRKEP